MRTYEGFLDKMYEKLPEFKLAIAIANLINLIKPELHCNYMRNSDGIWVVNNKERLVYFDVYLYKIDITIFAHHEELDKITDYLIYVFNSNIITFEIQKSDIPKYISELTKEKYDDFLINNDTKKYNL